MSHVETLLHKYSLSFNYVGLTPMSFNEFLTFLTAHYNGHQIDLLFSVFQITLVQKWFLFGQHFII